MSKSFLFGAYFPFSQHVYFIKHFLGKSCTPTLCTLYFLQIQEVILKRWRCSQNLESLLFTGCPKSSFLYFISLYFSTIGLGKQIIQTKVVFQSNSLFSCLLCHLLTRISDLCTSAPKVRVRKYIFQPHIFCILYRELLELLPCTLWISWNINPLNEKKFSYVRT